MTFSNNYLDSPLEGVPTYPSLHDDFLVEEPNDSISISLNEFFFENEITTVSNPKQTINPKTTTNSQIQISYEHKQI